jgi:hypothetical protein
MRTVEPAKSPSANASIDEVELDTVTGGCAVGGCCPSGSCGGGGYSYRQRSGGIDPMFMILAMSLFSQNK